MNPPSYAQSPPVQNELSTWVRNYVHYGNLASNYSKQATGARKLRDEFESKIIHNLRGTNMQNAVIQISGAQLQYAEEKTPASLSMPRLEEYLHAYFAQKGNSLDETEAIMRFLRFKRQQDATVTACLKKTPLASVSIPPPPSLPPYQQNGLK